MLKSIINSIDGLFNSVQKAIKDAQANADDISNIFIAKKNIDLSNITKPCNLILSPVFYWIRIESLPVKNTKQAKNIAPSCFSSHIPQGEYKYLAIKRGDSQDNNFMLFAYDEQAIIDGITSSNIDLSLINKIYFAQNEFNNDITLIDDKSCLYKKNNMYLMLPKNLSLSLDENMDSLDDVLSNISLSKHSIAINFNSGFISEKSLNILSISFIAIAISLGIEYFALKSAYKNLVIKEQKLISKYKIPKSSLQLRSIKGSLNKKLKAEVRAKENIQNLFDIPLHNGDFFKDIDIFDNRFSLVVSLKEINNAEIYKEYLIKYFSISSLAVKDDILIIKGGF